MGYVPKGAQKRLNTMAKVRANTVATLATAKAQVTARVLSESVGDIPRRLDAAITPQHVCRAYDVYFNGKRQQLCTVADVEKGYIVRYTKGFGNMGMTRDTERLFGKVQIVPKGAQPDAT